MLGGSKRFFRRSNGCVPMVFNRWWSKSGAWYQLATGSSAKPMCWLLMPVTFDSANFARKIRLALGFVKPELAETGTELEIDVLGKIKPAVVIAESPYDPENAVLRA